MLLCVLGVQTEMSERIEERVGSNRMQSAHKVFQIGGLVGLLRGFVVSRPSDKR